MTLSDIISKVQSFKAEETVTHDSTGMYVQGDLNFVQSLTKYKNHVIILTGKVMGKINLHIESGKDAEEELHPSVGYAETENNSEETNAKQLSEAVDVLKTLNDTNTLSFYYGANGSIIDDSTKFANHKSEENDANVVDALADVAKNVLVPGGIGLVIVIEKNSSATPTLDFDVERDSYTSMICPVAPAQHCDCSETCAASEENCGGYSSKMFWGVNITLALLLLLMCTVFWLRYGNTGSTGSGTTASKTGLA